MVVGQALPPAISEGKYTECQRTQSFAQLDDEVRRLMKEEVRAVKVQATLLEMAAINHARSTNQLLYDA